MEVAMEEQSYGIAYRAAMDAATAQLENLFEEAAQLRARMETINSLIDALKPLFADADSQEQGSELNPTKQQVDATLGMVLV
jgi:hypothetical protein